MTVRLRPLLPGDLPAVLGLERALFPDDAWSPGLFKEELGLEGRGRHYVAANDGDSVVGYAGLMLPGGRQAEVLTLAVDAGHWGRGIGSALLTDLLEEAGRHGCTEVFLEVRADNPRAQDLYRRFGFGQVGIRRGYYQPSGVDAIVMRRDLPGPADQRGAGRWAAVRRGLAHRRPGAAPDGHGAGAGTGGTGTGGTGTGGTGTGGAGQPGGVQ